jgi:hypothetical protein
MRQSWGEFLRGAGAGEHGVQVYGEPTELADSVAAYLASGFERGDPAVLVVTPANLALFGARLESRGWRLGAARAAGLLHVADAEQTLREILGHGEGLDDRFEEVVGGLLDRVDGDGRPVRVFGEMVDLLCRRGEESTAEELEQLWNELATKRSFALLCGYQLDVFAERSQLETLPAICRSHSHVLPARNYARFARSVDEALREVLGPNKAATVYVLVSRVANENHVPLAQQILMWVSENLPRQSSQILAVARARYGRRAA